MIKAFLKALRTRREWNRTRRFLSLNATSRAIVNLVHSGALTVPQGRRLVARSR